MNFNYFYILIVFILVIFIYLIKKKQKNKKIINKENKKEIDKKEKKEIETKEEKKENKEIKLPNEIKNLKNYSTNELNNKIQEEIKAAIELYQLDEETIKEMFKEAIKQINTAKEEIYKLLNEDNFEKLERQVHSLKGATLNLGFNTFGEPLKYINDNLKNNQLKKEEIKIYLDIIYEKLSSVKI